MKFIITAKKIQITEKIKEYIEERLGSCEKYINTDFPLIAKVELGKTTDHHNKGKIFMASVNIKLKYKFLRAEATREDIYLAINELRDRLKTELRKYKDIVVKNHKKPRKIF